MNGVDNALKLDRLQVYLQRLRATPAGADLWADSDGVVRGRVLDADVSSSFEPVRTPDGQVIGAQALANVRTADGAASSGDRAEPTPFKLFSRALSPDDLVAFDRRCRTVHTLNFFNDRQAPHDLFVRVHDRLLTAVADLHGRAFKRVLDSLGVPVSRVVIELPPAASPHTALLGYVIANYRLSGFRVAFNPLSFDDIERCAQVARVDFLRIDLRTIDSYHRADQAFGDNQRISAFRGLATPLWLYNVDDDADLAQARAFGARFVQGNWRPAN